MVRSNQHLPLPPKEQIYPWIVYYAAHGLTNQKIVHHLKSLGHFNTTKYGISVTSMKRVRGEWGIPSVRKSGWTIDNIGPYIDQVRVLFPTIGAGDMKRTLLQEHGVLVSRPTILDYNRVHHPEDVDACKRHKLKRRRYWAAGVSDIWTMDQHDKWQRFGLFLHVGLDPVSGCVLWLKIWWTNRNPRLIAKYYLDTIEEVGGMPLITQSDLGTENNGIANAQTHLRHAEDPSLALSLQHKWMRDKQNVKPEIFWGQLRRRWTPGFEDLIDAAVQAGTYDPGNALERLIFQWLFIPWLQSKLDKFKNRVNSSPKRSNRQSVLPRGPPGLIFQSPHLYNSIDFKVGVSPEHVQEARDLYAPEDHPVHLLVPPPIGDRLQSYYDDLGSPELNAETIWLVFVHLLHTFQNEDEDAAVQAAIQNAVDAPVVGEDPADYMPIIQGLREDRNGDRVTGPDGQDATRQDLEMDYEEDDLFSDEGDDQGDDQDELPVIEGYWTSENTD